jgi:predicted nucleic acid-binding protein
LRIGNGPLLLDYERFFSGPHLTCVSLSAAAHHRAARIRATHNYGLADSLHLAIAVENRLDRFLTNDNRLVGFPDIAVEMLP